MSKRITGPIYRPENRTGWTKMQDMEGRLTVVGPGDGIELAFTAWGAIHWVKVSDEYGYKGGPLWMLQFPDGLWRRASVIYQHHAQPDAETLVGPFHALCCEDMLFEAETAEEALQKFFGVKLWEQAMQVFETLSGIMAQIRDNEFTKMALLESMSGSNISGAKAAFIRNMPILFRVYSEDSSTPVDEQ